MPLDRSVITVADARANLSGALRRFRAEPSSPPVILGSHRKAEAALVPMRLYERLAAGAVPAPARPFLDELRERARLIRRLASLSNIRSVRVFGSVARGTDYPTSDVDLLVEPTDEASLFDLAQFADDMEQLLGRRVDVVSRRSLHPVEDAALLTDAVEL